MASSIIYAYDSGLQGNPDPPESSFFTADCGHEVYQTETVYESASGRVLCPDCMEDEIDGMTLPEKAALLGFNSWTVL